MILCMYEYNTLKNRLHLWLAGALRWSQLTIYNTKMRWSSGADDICFTRPAHTKFFALGRTVPIFRGEGVYQRSMDFLLEKLNNGEWVHMFPEGNIIQTGPYLCYSYNYN